MDILYADIINKLINLYQGRSRGCCLSILNHHGDDIFYIKLGNPTHCSIALCKKKAFTAYTFNNNPDEIYTVLSAMGSQPLIDKDYCFIPGGIVAENQQGKKIYIGISTDVAAIDKELAMAIANVFTEEK